MAELKDQLNWCSKSKNSLENLSYSIASSTNTLEAVISMLDNYNFSEFNQLLRPLQSQYNDGCSETQKFIADKHISYVENQVLVISSKLDDLKAQADTLNTGKK